MGGRNFREPALRITHADGDMNTDLRYVSHSSRQLADPNVTETVVKMTDCCQALDVELVFTAYARENVITTHTVIRNREGGSRHAPQLLFLGCDAEIRQIPADAPLRRLGARSAGRSHAADPRVEKASSRCARCAPPTPKIPPHAHAGQRIVQRELRRGHRRGAGGAGISGSTSRWTNTTC